RAMAKKPSPLGAAASRASSSVSTTKAPNSSKSAATSLLPEPIPPVKPTRMGRSLVRRLWGLRELARGRGPLRLLDRRLGGVGGYHVDLGDHELIDLLRRHVGDVLNRRSDASRRVVDREQRDLDVLTRAVLR